MVLLEGAWRLKPWSAAADIRDPCWAAAASVAPLSRACVVTTVFGTEPDGGIVPLTGTDAFVGIWDKMWALVTIYSKCSYNPAP